jgi:hypothetical protein
MSYVPVAGVMPPNQQRSFVCSLVITSSSHRCYLQKRVLNSSKGPAVRALRAQTDKREYAAEMRKVVERSVYLKNLLYHNSITCTHCQE